MSASTLYALGGALLLVAAAIFFLRMRSLVLGALFAGLGIMFVTFAVTERAGRTGSDDFGDEDD